MQEGRAPQGATELFAMIGFPSPLQKGSALVQLPPGVRKKRCPVTMGHLPPCSQFICFTEPVNCEREPMASYRLFNPAPLEAKLTPGYFLVAASRLGSWIFSHDLRLRGAFSAVRISVPVIPISGLQEKLPGVSQPCRGASSFFCLLFAFPATSASG